VVKLAARYLAPVARINREHCRRMAAAFAEQRWTARQAGAFYRAWRDAHGAVRERILTAPKVFAKTQAQTETLDRELNQITAIAQRALEQMESPPPNRAAVRRKIQGAIELLTELWPVPAKRTSRNLRFGSTRPSPSSAGIQGCSRYSPQVVSATGNVSL
jgi:hypothetical protein